MESMEDAAKRLHEAWRELTDSILDALGIPRLARWLSERLR